MSKLRADSQWNDLTAEQRDTLEAWLFEENISYREAIERMQKDFGITAPMSSLSRLYQRMAKERMVAELNSVCDTSHEVDGRFLDSDFLSNTAMILLKKRMIQVAIESPNKVNELAMLARIVVANESVGVKKYWVERDQERHTDELEEKLAKAKREKATWLKIKDMTAQWAKEAENSTPSRPGQSGTASPQHSNVA